MKIATTAEAVAPTTNNAVSDSEMAAKKRAARKGPADLAGAVEALVQTASAETDPRVLRAVVETLLDAFDAAKAPARDAALRALGPALAKAEGRGAQVLALALGALVEAGASPELAWPAAARELGAVLDRATAFATAATRAAKDHDVDSAVEAAGADVARKKPREGNAWKALPARCLAAVACLTRSKKLRAKAGRDEGLLASCWPLSDAVAEVGYLLQALRILDGGQILVLAGDRGYRITVDAMPSNAELYVLLADALGGRIRGKRPDPRAVSALKDGHAPKKGATSVKVPFQLFAWSAIDDDGSLGEHASDHHVWVEGIPADIPLIGKDRIVLLEDLSPPHTIPIAPSFESLRPDLRLTAELGPDEVARIRKKLVAAAKKLRPKSRKR